MMDGSLAEQIIRQILIFEMELDPQTIWVRDQNKKIAPEKGLFISVGYVDGDVLGAVTSVESQEFTPPAPADPYSAMTEIQQVVMRENIQIDIMSRDFTAVQRRAEVLLALASIYSTQMQEKNSFKIFRIPVSFPNTSDSEGGSKINKFSITIPCHVWYRKEKVLVTPEGDFYNDFDTRVDDAKTIGTEHGIIEFNIHEEV